MLAKVLVLTIAVVAVSSENIHYRLKTVVHEAPKEYRHHPQHIPIREYHEAPVSEEQYKLPENHPESHGHAYSSQSVVHHGQSAAYEESHEANADHVAPVYQYVDEQNEEQNVHHATPVKHKYHSVHYPAPAPAHQEVQTNQVPHYQVPAHYQPESHEVPAYHREVPAYHHEVPAYHSEAPQQEVQHYEVPHNTPQHAHQEVPVHHVAESQESHDEPIDYYAYPKYQYEYKVEDPHTGDNKFQHEIRDGDVVKGIYGLHEADGSFRTVEYSSDKHKGFSAIVKHSAPGQHVHIESHHKN